MCRPCMRARPTGGRGRRAVESQRGVAPPRLQRRPSIATRRPVHHEEDPRTAPRQLDPESHDRSPPSLFATVPPRSPPGCARAAHPPVQPSKVERPQRPLRPLRPSQQLPAWVAAPSCSPPHCRALCSFLRLLQLLQPCIQRESPTASQLRSATSFSRWAHAP